MNSRHSPIAVALLAALAGVGYGAYQFGLKQAGGHAAGVADATATTAEGRRVLYWHDPMVPGQRFDKPGKSPFMDMPLVPVYADAAADEGSVAVSARQTQSLGLRTVAVQRGTLAPAFETSGSVAWNERGLTLVQARNTAFVEKLLVRATLDPVRRGQPLAELYVPDWVAAQEEFLALRAMPGGVEALVDAARVRMRQAGMPPALIAQVEKEGQVLARVTLTAPVAGRVVELGAREGMTVMAGATLFQINALDSVWVNAEVPEGQAALLQPGAPVQTRAAGFPGDVFKGRVQAILPEVEAATRTLRVRVELANPGGRLAPGMYVRLGFGTPAREALLLPQDALIRTGQRSVVMLAEGEGKYRPVDVRIGQEADGQVEITAGLSEGQQVVLSGQFLLDSEASLRAVAPRLSDAPAAAAGKEYQVEAVFESVVDELAMLSHPPVPELKWGAMTMGFRLPQDGLPKDLKPGQKVHVVFCVPEGGEPQLVHVMAIGGGQ
ncbi:MAG: efflux transporter periplasmic adaptor subunit [Candidatus Dactylopiibacterium carminicum]|uniref:Efflux RND transporter periplasmic adaptor subunit n=1 Tax=Candidatus Dactylopiibacterium carminicum TaxID=857335 RepID=A0A272EYR1_9RHOO|nr:efflux RND transporter periplasmic adaptor subunit [Candidatus Dactylopiibacterium carminicum]KAF7600222.1 efflux RND transporter periplasmic adaptor subunit [Candidatus Dactylopiibacterium carminicum]PAS94760.1 MAG: efflux transporter periplasmic adaptor subunit [Candidatus Dactylopiibacterium carminicum]PAS97685.1 MAG: efflux transporter periplasmic adaptor subunit [Candidatus Dactylopiibacterium carminicum]PAT00218.1 MAG: efflux transporter periplasmic adaptor subunit [Candidatus Dactylop